MTPLKASVSVGCVLKSSICLPLFNDNGIISAVSRAFAYSSQVGDRSLIPEAKIVESWIAVVSQEKERDGLNRCSFENVYCVSVCDLSLLDHCTMVPLRISNVMEISRSAAGDIGIEVPGDKAYRYFDSPTIVRSWSKSRVRADVIVFK